MHFSCGMVSLVLFVLGAKTRSNPVDSASMWVAHCPGLLFTLNSVSFYSDVPSTCMADLPGHFSGKTLKLQSPAGAQQLELKWPLQDREGIHAARCKEFIDTIKFG